jgi:hypothetical protein
MADPAEAPDGEALSKMEAEAERIIRRHGGDPIVSVLALVAECSELRRELALCRAAVSSGFSRQWHHKGSRFGNAG